MRSVGLPKYEGNGLIVQWEERVGSMAKGGEIVCPSSIQAIYCATRQGKHVHPPLHSS